MGVPLLKQVCLQGHRDQGLLGPCVPSRNSRCLGQELSLTGCGVLGVGMEEARLRHSEVGQLGVGWGHSWWGPVDQ